MEDQMYLVITLRKAVEDREEGRMLFDLVKQRLSDRPDVIVAGMVTNHFDMD